MKTRTQVTKDREQKKRSSEAMSPEVAIDKCDQIGGNLVLIYKAAAKARASIAKNEPDSLLDYIFGRSEENPCEAISVLVKEKEEAYTERIDGLVESVKKAKLKRKINR